MIRLFLLLVLLFTPIRAADGAENRIWNTVRGKKIEGSLLHVEGENVVLQKKNSKETVTVPKEDLMPVDTLYLEQLEKKKIVPAETPSSPGDKRGADGPPAAEPASGDDAEVPGEPAKSRLYPRTKEEIRSGLRAIYQRDKSKVVSREVHDAINRLNAYRFLSGLYSEVGTEPHMIKGAQDASKACAESGQLSHSLGHSTDKCNLSMGRQDMASSVDGYISDGGTNNRERRGHRRWCLNPPLKNAGFGREGNFSAMWCMDSSGTGSRDGWSYPGKGLYPHDYVQGNAWSYYHTGALPPDTEVKMWKLTRRPEQMLAFTAKPAGREIDVDYKFVYDNTINWEPVTKGKRGIYWVRIHGRQVREQYLVELF